MRSSAKEASSEQRRASSANHFIHPLSWRSQSFSLVALLFALCAAASRPACAFNAHQPFDISADILDYVDDTQEITARGHVVIVQSSSTLNADVVRYDRRHRRLLARGRVILRENNNVMLGDQMDYDLVQEKGIVLGGKGTSSSWFFQGASWEKNEDYYIGRNASFTSCDLIDPHYHIRTSRVHLIPDRLFWSWNNVFYVDDKPVFYTPFMYKYLDKERVVFQVQPGNDSTNGTFAKTTTTMRFTDNVYDKFFWDYYTQAGSGFGNELDFQKPNRYKGSLFGYYINPQPAAVLPGAPTGPQYSYRGDLWERLSPTVQLQANTDISQNIAFNTQFVPQDPNQSETDILSSIALTQQTKSYNQHLVVDRMDGPDSTVTGPFETTHVQTADLPSYTFTLFSRPLWSPKVSTGTAPTPLAGLAPGTTAAFRPSTPSPSKIGPLLFNMSTVAQSQYQRLDNLIHNGAQTNVSLSQSFPFARDWSYNAAVTPLVNWQDKGDVDNVSTDTQKGFTGKTTVANGMRWRPTSALTLDADHTLTERMKPNDLEFARDTTDHGVEANQLALSANMRPSSRLLFRTSSGFDMRKLDDESLLDYEQRKWMPWSTDLTYTPNRRWDYYAQNIVGFYPARTESWQVSGTYHGLYKTSIMTAFLYNRSAPQTVSWNETIGYYFGPGWRVDASFNAGVPSTSIRSTRDANLINTQLILVRDMHCWQTQFIYRDTPPFSREYSILFNLKLGPTSAKPIADQNLESQFYPWRSTGPDPSIR
jgi:lipopolysaccharide export system protein LptA